jgi:hypothetical protein
VIRPAVGVAGPADNLRSLNGGAMASKVPQKHEAKKVGKTLKEKRVAKQAKKTDKRPLV